MKDEAKDQAVIVFMGPRCCGIPTKARAQPGHAPANAQQKARWRCPADLAAHLSRLRFLARVAIRVKQILAADTCENPSRKIFVK